MGTSTKLYVSSRWELEDIKTIIENRFDVKIKVKDCSKTSIGMFQFVFKVGDNYRSMAVFVNHSTPLGVVTYLSLGHNDQAVEIMRTIANVLGGLLQEKDYKEIYVMISGKFDEENALPYFFKWAMILDEMKDENDLVGLNRYIHKWYDKINTSRDKMNLFELEKD